MKAIEERGAIKYENNDDREFCTVSLGDYYPLAKFKEVVVGKDWRLYIFYEPIKRIPIWAICIDLPPNWSKTELPMESASEPVQQFDNQISLVLSGDNCTENKFKKTFLIIYENLKEGSI